MPQLRSGGTRTFCLIGKNGHGKQRLKLRDLLPHMAEYPKNRKTIIFFSAVLLARAGQRLSIVSQFPQLIRKSDRILQRSAVGGMC